MQKSHKNNEDKEAEVKAVEELLRADPLTWGQYFFPHHFREKTPLFHHEMLVAALEHDRLAVASPRRSAKSTLLLFLFPFHRIMFRASRFIVIISNTFKKASMHLDTIKKELADNQKIKEAHPHVTLKRDAEGDTIFRHPDGFETWVLCKGVEQIGSLRGVKFGAWRPDLVLGDDMEDDELVRSSDRRAQLKDDFDSVLTPIGGNEKTKHVYVGTVLHDDSQLAKLVSKDFYPEYLKLFYKAHLNVGKENETSLWPENWTLDFLNEMMKEKPLVYAKEYQNDPVAGSNTRFSSTDFRYWKIENDRAMLLNLDQTPYTSYSLKECRAAVACDLAWKEKRGADSSVIMPGFLTPNSEILIDSYISKKGLRPDEFASHLFIMVERLERLTGSSVPVGFEKAMLETVTKWFLNLEMRKRNKFLLTKDLKWDADKNTRIETRLQARYSQHMIYHRTGMGDLEHQLTRFPYGTHDDLADSAQGLVQLLQFPKAGRAEEKETDMFEEIMNIRKKRQSPFSGFGQKKRKDYFGVIPARRTLW